MSDEIALGRFVRQARLRVGLSQRDLDAALPEQGAGYAAQLENGRVLVPPPSAREAICAATGANRADMDAAILVGLIARHDLRTASDVATIAALREENRRLRLAMAGARQALSGAVNLVTWLDVPEVSDG